MPDPRLNVFVKLNNGPEKVPWQERIKLIRDVFPSTVKTDWNKAFRDVDLFGRLLRDILKVDQTQPGRSGPRPVLNRDKATERLRQFMGTDYTDAPFPVAFRHIAGARSVRHIATQTGIHFVTVQRLLTGERDPKISEIEQIARAFKKDPSFFIEYRTAYVLGALADRMALAPEMTLDLYRRLNPRR